MNGSARFRGRARGQSEVLGITILTGVVVIVALTVGAVVVSQASGDDPGPTTDLVLRASSENVTLAHNGGDTLDRAPLTVVLTQKGHEKRFTPAAANVTGGDDRIQPGERIHRRHGLGPGDVEVLVVHDPSGSVLLDDRERIPA